MTIEPAATPGPALSPEERRAYVRVRKRVHVTCRIVSQPKESADGLTRNISAGGLLLSTQRALALGTLLHLTVALEAEGVSFSVTGRVAWAEFNAAAGMHDLGVCFLGMDQTQRQNVMAIIAQDEHHERRIFIRLQRHLIVEYKPAHKFLSRWHDSHTQDVSLGGLLLIVADRLETGTEIVTKIHLDDLQADPLEFDGIVIDSKPAKAVRGMMQTHMKFAKEQTESHKRLAAYISRTLTAKSLLSPGITPPPPTVGPTPPPA